MTPRTRLPGLLFLLLAFAVGCTTPPPVKKEPEPEPPPVVKEEPKPEPPKEEPKPLPPLVFDTIYFAYNQAAISGEGRGALKRAVEQLLARPEAKVDIEGHCDERGTDEYNIDLGWKRAYAVRDWLVRQGVAESRLYPTSYGRARPAVVGSDESAWSKNRRVALAERK